jgi:hypothetical protein
MSSSFINLMLAPSNASLFTNSLSNDVIFNTPQRFLFGTSNSASLIINSNSIYFNSINFNTINYTGNLYQKGVLITGWSNTSSNTVSNLWWASNVGIGKSNPLYNLDVVGSVLISSNLFVNNNLTVSNIVNITSNLNILNSLTINSNLSVLTASILGVTSTANIMPLSNLLYDLGSSTMRYRSLYLGSNTIDLMGYQLHADTSGLRVDNATIKASQIQIGNNNNLIKISVDSSNKFAASTITLSNGIFIASNTVSVSSINLLSIDSNNSAFISTSNTWSVISTSNIIYNPAMALTIDSTGTDTASCIELDSANNLYVCGSYTGATPTIYNSNGGSSGLTVPFIGGLGAYIVKYNSSGTASWITAVDGTGSESTNSVAVDSLNNVIVTGSYTANPNIYSAGSVLTNTSNVASLGTPCNAGAYIVKYDTNGTTQWATHIDSLGTDSGNSVVCDTANNIYVAGTSTTGTGVVYDTGSNVVAGNPTVVINIAGTGSPGFGDLNSPVFWQVTGICIDTNNNIFIADYGNNRIRKITMAGYATPFAGLGNIGYLDGTGINSLFNNPTSICIDTANNLYIADSFNHRIRKITPSAVVTTIAGNGIATFVNGNGTNTSFNHPQGIAVDSSGNLYVSDTGNNRIRKIDTSGNVTTIAGIGIVSSVDGTGTNAGFNSPFGLKLNNGILYIADLGNNKIRKMVLASSIVSTIAGSGSGTYLDGIGTNSCFYHPYDVCIDNTSDNLYVTDQINHRIRKIVLTTGVVTTIAGTGVGTFVNGIGSYVGFNYPEGITIDNSGKLYVGDFSSIRQITVAIDPSFTITNSNSPIALLPNVGTSTDQSAFVVKYNPSGVSQWAVTVDGVNNAENGASVCVDTSQNVYLVGTYGSNVARVYQNSSVSGLPTLTATNSNAAFGVKINSSGVPQWFFYLDGLKTDQALGSCVDTSGNLFICGSYDSSPGPIVYSSLATSTYTSAFLIKYTAGNSQWATSIRGISGSNIATSVVLDSNNNIYLTGTYQGKTSPLITDYNGSNSGLSLPVPTGNSGSNLASFVVKYNSSGVPMGAYGIVGPSSTIANSIAVTNSNIYIAGNLYTGTTTYDGNALSSNLVFPGSLTTQAGFISQYSPIVSPYYLLSNLNSNGFQKYITNASSSNITLKVGTNSYIINSTSNTLFNYYNNTWYKCY